MQEVKANGVKNVTGSVRPRPSKENVKYYDVILELGRDPYTGKRKRVSFRAETTDRNEAENILTIKKAEYLQGTMLIPTKMTVEELMKEFLENIKAQRTPSTVRDYTEKTKCYIIPEFGKIKIQDLKKAKIQNTLLLILVL